MMSRFVLCELRSFQSCLASIAKGSRHAVVKDFAALIVWH